MVGTLGPGGTERQVVEIAKNLDPDRFAPHVACLDAGGFRARELRDKGIPILELPLRSLLSRSYLASARLLRGFVRERGIRLVHAFDFPTIILAVPLCRLWGGLVVLAGQRGHRETFPPKYRFLLRMTDPLTHGFVANCEAMRRHLVEDYRIPDRKIRVCYNGIDLACFPPRDFDAPRGGCSSVGAVSLLRWEKGIETLIDAYAETHKRHPEARLRIVGGGPLLDSLKARSQALFGASDACRFEPSTNDVACCLHEFDVFVLPSLSEAFSNSLMEAMACGCAVVASRTGGNPELVKDGETGLLFQPGDPSDLAAKLNLLFEDHTLRRSLAEAGQSFLRGQFSMEISARRAEQIYEEFLSGQLSAG
jgi:glycosyltransferase involved in cell wall biosynthesis